MVLFGCFWSRAAAVRALQSRNHTTVWGHNGAASWCARTAGSDTIRKTDFFDSAITVKDTGESMIASQTMPGGQLPACGIPAQKNPA